MSRRPLFLVALAALSASAAGFVWLVAFHGPGGRRLDAAALQAFAGAVPPHLEPSTNGVAVLANPLPFAILGALLVAVALLRRRWLMAAVVPAILLAANVCAQVLKPALTDPRVIDVDEIVRVYHGSWPSGHATASMSLALCLVLVVGRRLRPLAAVVGAGYAIGVGYALVAAGWHLPSDVFGGYLVAASFTLLGAAALAALESRQPAADGGPTAIPWRALAAPLAALAGIGAVMTLAAIARTPDAAAGLRHVEALVVAFAIAALGLALTAGLALALRRSS
jgi:membrane-associated phospholipid phosphatase